MRKHVLPCLLDQTPLPPALRAIAIANLLALNNAARVPDTLQTMLDSVAAQPADFEVTWAFNGTRHFISQHAQLAPYRSWLGQLFIALEAEDRQAVLTDLQAARASFPGWHSR